MCIAILQKQDAEKITEKDFMSYADRNPHGFGLLYVENGKLEPEWTLDKNEFWKTYNDIFDRVNKESPILIHYRLSTGGKKDILNCHPFMVSDDLGFIHNGIINIQEVNKDVSDTYSFNELVLKPVGDNCISNRATMDMIQDYIGSYNKLIFLRYDKEYVIYNEDAGEWSKDKKTWLSFKTTYTQPSKGKTYNFYKNKQKYCTNNYYAWRKSEWNKCSMCGVDHMNDEMVTIITAEGEVSHICNNCCDHEVTIHEAVLSGIFNSNVYEGD